MAPHAEEKHVKQSHQEVRSKSYRNKSRKSGKYSTGYGGDVRFGSGWLAGVIAVAAVASLYCAPLLDSGLRYAARSFLELKEDPILKMNQVQQPMVQEKQEKQEEPTGYVCKHGYTIKILSQDPFIVYLKDFLQEGEAEHIKSLAEPFLYRSPVGHQNGYSDHRTSYTASLHKAQTDIVRCVEERASHFIDTPWESIESLQVVRYDVGQQYKIHQPESGGNTTFYDAGISVPPKKNDGVFWLNVNADGEEDIKTNHAGEPVLSGQKWAINIWPHKWTDQFRKEPAPKRYYATDKAEPTYVA
ncbi:hypothetical protein BDF19DRAFT_429988 [Syncephalis fuscata]|nr:hypothetical protein BDF19DRAFT_429988 [Syncephalis fuscata]